MARPGYAVNCWLGQYDFTKTPPTYHVKVPSHYVIATFQLDGSLMLESPDYFFRVREIGRLRQTMVLIGPHYTNLLYITFQHIPQASSSTSVSPRYTYRVKIINPSQKKESVTRELRRYNGRFASVTEMKVRIVEEFDDYVPQTRRFSVGYFDPNLAATKRWICCDDDIAALYDSYKAYQGKEILLWCEGCSSKEEDNTNCPTTKRRRKGSNSREDQESKVEELATELQEMHEDNLQLSELHYRLWARMIVTGVYLKKDTPPQVPMITGVAPKRNLSQWISLTKENLFRTALLVQLLL